VASSGRLDPNPGRDPSRSGLTAAAPSSAQDVGGERRVSAARVQPPPATPSRAASHGAQGEPATGNFAPDETARSGGSKWTVERVDSLLAEVAQIPPPLLVNAHRLVFAKAFQRLSEEDARVRGLAAARAAVNGDRPLERRDVPTFQKRSVERTKGGGR
jgi:hypothetical protein